MKKEKKVRAYQRRTKSGQMVTVKAHTAKYDAAEEALKKAAKRKGAGDELEALKKTKDSELCEGYDFTKAEFAEWYEGTGSAADKKVEKALRKSLGKKAYEALSDLAANNYKKGGANSFFKKNVNTPTETASSPKDKTVTAEYARGTKKEKVTLIGKQTESDGVTSRIGKRADGTYELYQSQDGGKSWEHAEGWSDGFDGNPKNFYKYNEDAKFIKENGFKIVTDNITGRVLVVPDSYKEDKRFKSPKSKEWYDKPYRPGSETPEQREIINHIADMVKTQKDWSKSNTGKLLMGYAATAGGDNTYDSLSPKDWKDLYAAMKKDKSKGASSSSSSKPKTEPAPIDHGNSKKNAADAARRGVVTKEQASAIGGKPKKITSKKVEAASTSSSSEDFQVSESTLKKLDRKIARAEKDVKVVKGWNSSSIGAMEILKLRKKEFNDLKRAKTYLEKGERKKAEKILTEHGFNMKDFHSKSKAKKAPAKEDK